MDRERLSFLEGMMFVGSNCDNVGHDEDNAIVGYDFKGMVAKVCPRPWCMEVIEYIAVDDLTREEFDELIAVIDEVSHNRDE